MNSETIRETRGLIYLVLISSCLILLVSSNLGKLFFINEWSWQMLRRLMLPLSHLILGFSAIYYGSFEARKWWGIINLLQSLNYVLATWLIFKAIPVKGNDPEISVLAEIHTIILAIPAIMAALYLIIGLMLLLSPAIKDYQAARQTKLIFRQLQADRFLRELEETDDHS